MKEANRTKSKRASSKIALSGVICALSISVMLLTAFVPGFLDYLAPGLAGILLLPLLFEFDAPTAWTAYAATALISFMVTPAKEACLLFLLFFGYYPIVHMKLKLRYKKRWLNLLLGFLLFNISMVLTYFLMFEIFGWGSFSSVFGNILYLFLLVGNLSFVLYDYCLDQIPIIYTKKIHPKVARLFKLYR